MKEDVAKRVFEWLQGSEEFVVEQAPKLVEEVLFYGALSSSFWVVFCSLFGAILGYIAYRGIKQEKEEGNLFAAIIVLFMLIPLIDFFENALNLIQIWIAPRMYLIEYFSGLIEGGGAS